MSTVVVERDEHLATVTLNRPDKLNALNEELLQELGRAILSSRATRRCAASS